MIRSINFLCLVALFGSSSLPVAAQDPSPEQAAVTTIDLPFVPSRISVSADGAKAVAWDAPRNQTDSQSLAVVDLSNRKLMAQAILQIPLLDVAVGEDVYVVDANAFSRLSFDDLAPQATFRNVIAPRQFSVRQQPTSLLRLVANQRLSTGPQIRLALPDLSLLESYDHDINTSEDWLEGRCGFGWLLEGVLWGDAMAKPLLLIWPYEFRRIPFSFSSREPGEFQPTTGTWYPYTNKPARPPDSNVIASATSPDIAATLRLMRDVNGYQLASFRLDNDELIASLLIAPSEGASNHRGRPAHGIPANIVTGGNRFVVLLSGRLYVGSLEALRDKETSLPFHIVPRQSTFVLAADKPTTFHYEAVGAARFRLSSRSLGSNEKPFEAISEMGEFTLSVADSLDKILGDAAGLAANLNQGRAINDNHQRAEFFAGPSRAAFRRLVGRDAKGLPLPIDIHITAEGADFATAVLRHDFLVDVSLQDFEEALDRKYPHARSPWKKPTKEFDLTNYPASASAPSGSEAVFAYLRDLWKRPHPEFNGAALRDAAQQAKAAGDKRMHDRYVSWTANKQWRTWTDADGRQTEALLVQVFAGQVTLRTRRGVEFTVDETKLSEGDREFLQNTPEPVTPNDGDLWREFVVAEAARTVSLFHNAHKVYPPRALTDDTSQPRLSWRVLILSELGYGELFALFHFDEPWNSDYNRELIPFIPNALTLDAQLAETGKTTLMTVSSPLSAMPTSGVANVRNIASEANSTIVFVEAVSSRATEWTKPVDLQLYEFAAPESVVRTRDTKILVGLLSGTAIWIPADTSRDDWRFAIDLGDGHKILEPSMP